MSPTISNRISSHRATLQDNSMDELARYDRPEEVEQARPPFRRRRLIAPDSFVPTYIGIGLVMVGFALIAVAWGRVAGEANVALQTPYVVSAGFTGLGFIMCGLVVVNIAAKRQGAAERGRQFAELSDLLRELQGALEDEQHRR